MPPEQKKTDIAIVDDHPVVIEGLQRILYQAFGDVYIGCFATGELFLGFLEQHKNAPDIVLLDIILPGINGVELCREIKKRSPETRVLVFSNRNERSLMMKMLHYGASGYILKNASAEEVINCINKVLNGQIALSREVTEIMARPTLDDLKTLPALTKREKEILPLIADGHTSIAIAAILHLSPLTIETHRRNLLQKFEVKNAAELVKLVTRQQLI